MYIKRINKGGSLLVTPNAPRESKKLGLKRWSGTVYHVPSLKYLADASEVSDDIIDAINTYFESLSVGDKIDWDVQTDEPVYYTQDRHGKDLPEPRKSTRLYADIDLEKLESAILGDTSKDDAPVAPTRRRAGAKS